MSKSGDTDKPKDAFAVSGYMRRSVSDSKGELESEKSNSSVLYSERYQKSNEELQVEHKASQEAKHSQHMMNYLEHLFASLLGKKREERRYKWVLKRHGTEEEIINWWLETFPSSQIEEQERNLWAFAENEISEAEWSQTEDRLKRRYTFGYSRELGYELWMQKRLANLSSLNANDYAEARTKMLLILKRVKVRADLDAASTREKDAKRKSRSENGIALGGGGNTTILAPEEKIARRILEHKKWLAGDPSAEQLVLADTIIKGVDLKGVRIQHSVFTRCTFKNLDLSKTSFRKSDLTGSIFVKCNLMETDFTGAILESVRFSNCNERDAVGLPNEK